MCFDTKLNSMIFSILTIIWGIFLILWTSLDPDPILNAITGRKSFFIIAGIAYLSLGFFACYAIYHNAVRLVRIYARFRIPCVVIITIGSLYFMIVHMIAETNANNTYGLWLLIVLPIFKTILVMSIDVWAILSAFSTAKWIERNHRPTTIL